MTEIDLTMRSPEKRLPLLEMMPDMAHPDGFLNIPSLTFQTSSKSSLPPGADSGMPARRNLSANNKGVHHIAS